MNIYIPYMQDKLDDFKKDINELRQLLYAKNNVVILDEVNMYKPWALSIRRMFDNDCRSRSTDEFLISKYLPLDIPNVRQKSNHDVLALLILTALVNPRVEQKVLFHSVLLPDITTCDIMAVVRRNFESYEIITNFYSEHNLANLIVMAQK